MSGEKVFELETKENLCDLGLFWLLRGLSQREFSTYNHLKFSRMGKL